MRAATLLLLASVLFGLCNSLGSEEKVRREDTISSDADGRVIHVRLPNEDIGISYAERFPVFVVNLTTKHAEIEAQDLYIGDGSVAAPMTAHQSHGIFLLGDIPLKSGDRFKKGSTIKLKKGFKSAKDLKPGEIYVILPGIKFERPTD